MATIDPETNAIVAKAGQQFKLSALFSVPAAASDPTYLILSGLDRDEYTTGYNLAAMGSLSGNGVTDKFSNAGGDAYSVGIVFTYQASSGQYYNATYGDLSALTCTASANTNDNVCFSLYGTSNASFAATYAASPYTLEQNPGSFSYLGSVTMVTQPAVTQAIQATPKSIVAAAESFVGKAWNLDGCWVLASNIAAVAGASLPASATLADVPGVANGEWIVAYDGPVSANANWEQNVTAGEMVGFVTTAGGGHITTVVSGAGSTAQLIDNITYVNANGTIQNAANDGSANDILVSSPHAATQEFNGVNPSEVVVYELDTPTVKDLVTALSLAERTSKSLAATVSASNPVASQSVTEYQLYDANTADSITLSGVAQTAAHSAANAVTASSLTSVGILAGGAAGNDTIEIRAYNGKYYGDWQSLAVTITAPASPPTLTAQTANRTFKPGQKLSFALAANTFTDPQGETLSYAATQSNGAALPAWLSFNAATKTFSGTVPTAATTLTLKITATDTTGLSATETFGVTVPATTKSVTTGAEKMQFIASAASPTTRFAAGKLAGFDIAAGNPAAQTFQGSGTNLATAVNRGADPALSASLPASFGAVLLTARQASGGSIGGPAFPHHVIPSFV
jgi:hypothetical protein